MNDPWKNARRPSARPPRATPLPPREGGTPPPPGRGNDELRLYGWNAVQALFEHLPAVLDAGGLFTVYGPFRYDGAHTSDSNAAFDAALRAADPLRGVRDFEAVAALAREAGLELLEDRAMPAHNRCITWRRVAAA